MKRKNVGKCAKKTVKMVLSQNSGEFTLVAKPTTFSGFIDFQRLVLIIE
jgi:hypothetical protein